MCSAFYPVPSLQTAALSLLLERFSRSRVRHLCATHGNPVAALSAGSRISARLKVSGRRDYLALEEVGLLVVEPGGKFPDLLECIPDPPLLLYYRGDLAALEQPGIALVGARRASRYGLELAANLAHALAGCGATVVSGLALGVDAAAHRGALAAGGRTIAVLGSGLNRVQPVSNLPLAERVLGNGGLLLSEYPLEKPAAPHQFPERNRLISGLCSGVVVVEASARSGSLITARLAAEQGREVMAVPGAPGLPNSAGVNRLLKAGAALIENVEDVLDALGLLQHAVRAGSLADLAGEPALTAELAQVLELLDDQALSLDALGASLGLTAADCAVRLTELELGGFVQRVADGYIRRPAEF